MQCEGGGVLVSNMRLIQSHRKPERLVACGARVLASLFLPRNTKDRIRIQPNPHGYASRRGVLWLFTQHRSVVTFEALTHVTPKQR